MRRVLFFCFGLVLLTGLSRAEESTPQRLAAPTELHSIGVSLQRNYEGSYVTLAWKSEARWFEVYVESPTGEDITLQGAQKKYWINTTENTGVYTEYKWNFSEAYEQEEYAELDSLLFKVRCVTGNGSGVLDFIPDADESLFSEWASLKFSLIPDTTLIKPDSAGLTVEKGTRTNEDGSAAEIRVFGWTVPANEQTCEVEIFMGESVETGSRVKTTQRIQGEHRAEWWCQDMRAAKGTYAWRIRGIKLDEDDITLLDSTEWVTGPVFSVDTDYSVRAPLRLPSNLRAVVGSSDSYNLFVTMQWGQQEDEDAACEVKILNPDGTVLYAAQNAGYALVYSPEANKTQNPFTQGGTYTLLVRAVYYADRNQTPYVVIDSTEWASQTFVIEKVAEPVFAAPRGTYVGSVVLDLSCENEGATLYYKINEGDWTKYTESVTLPSGTHYVYAYGYKVMAIRSGEVNTKYTVKNSASSIMEPVAAPAEGSYKDSVEVSLVCYQLGAKVYYSYTGGDLLLYSEPFVIRESALLRAIAVLEKDGNRIESDTLKVNYTITTDEEPEPEPVVPDTVARPVFVGWSAEVYQDSALVELKCDTADAEIYYRRATVDTFALYTTAFYIHDTTRIYAFAAKEGLINSDTVEKTYYVAKTVITDTGNNHEPEPVVPDTVARPVFVGWSAEVYQDSALVELKCDTADAEIYYRRATVDTFALYTTAFYIHDTTRIYAFAAKEGLINSDTVFAVYYVAKTPVEDTTGPTVRNEENILAGVKLYPNPSTGTIHLNLPCQANVEVFTLSGAVVLKENSVEGFRTYTLTRAGLYLVRVSVGEKTTVRKVTIN